MKETREREDKEKYQRKLMQEREKKRELVEEFRYQKEMQKQRDQQVAEMEKLKLKENTRVSDGQKERILKREQEQLVKK